jgi:hypothetical protein
MTEKRISFHNGRAGKKGTYSDKHNDRNFNLENAMHIDSEKTKDNIYINYVTEKVYSHEEKIENEIESFSDSELKFYEENFGNFIKKRNEKNKKNNNYSRIADAKKIKTMERYAPEEVIFQIGNQDNFSNEDFNKFLNVYNDFINWYKEEYPDIKLLNAGIHVDETTPHIHLRQVYTAIDKDGDLYPSQTDCLKNMGIERPDPTKKKTKYNNPKVTFSQRNRKKLLELCEEYGLEVETEPLYGGKKHQEKNDFIIQKQEEEKADLSQNNYNLRSENINLIKNNSNLKKENKNLKDKNLNLSLENKRFKRENEKLKEENKKINREKIEISTKLNELKENFDEENAKRQQFRAVLDLTNKYNYKLDNFDPSIEFIKKKGLMVEFQRSYPRKDVFEENRKLKNKARKHLNLHIIEDEEKGNDGLEL